MGNYPNKQILDTKKEKKKEQSLISNLSFYLKKTEKEVQNKTKLNRKK